MGGKLRPEGKPSSAKKKVKKDSELVGDGTFTKQGKIAKLSCIHLHVSW